MIAVDLSKQQTFDADTKSLRQTNFTGSRTLIQNKVEKQEWRGKFNLKK